MQNRMKNHMLTANQSTELLNRSMTATLATVDNNNMPYVTPVHYIYFEECIFIHGLNKGQKIDNIKNNNNVSFNVFDMDCLLVDSQDPANTNTKYQSVIISGSASLVTDLDLKRKVLQEFVLKYVSFLKDKSIKENMVLGTGIIKIDIKEISGKYYG